MLLPPTIAAWLHGFVASLLALVLVAGGAGGAALADLAHCGTSEAACDCDDADCDTAAVEDGDADTEHADAGDRCCSDESAAPCTPGCDDCGCCPGAMSALPPAAMFVLGEQPGGELDLPVSPPVQGARGTSVRVDRPPRAPLCCC